MSGPPVNATAHRRRAPGRDTRSAPVAAGVALVEIMIALVLSLVVVAALGQLYAGSRQSYALNEALARLNENGRFAIDFLANDIRMAGYLSCGGATARIGNTVNAVGNWIYDRRGLVGYEGGVSTPPSEFTGQVRTGTDILIIRRAALELERQLIRNDAPSGVLKLGLDHGFQVGEVLVIANPSCTQASLFQVAATLNLDHTDQASKVDAIKYGPLTGVGPGNCTSALFGAFDCSQTAVAEAGVFSPGSVVSRFAVHAYYVTATDPPTLVRKRLSQSGGQAALITEELIRDVENFQVLYGRDTIDDGIQRANDYVTANLVTDWSKVVSIRLALLMRARDDNIRAKAVSQSFNLLGTSVTPAADRRIRRSVSGVVALRNNLP